MKAFLDLLRELGDAVFELAAAEIGALSADLRRGGRQAATAVAWAFVAVVLAVLAWALFTLALVWGLAELWGPWRAALAVGALYLAVAIGCAAAAWAGFRRMEPPAETVRRRIEEQRSWFRQRILAVESLELEGSGEERSRVASGEQR